ncbi:MAG: hypothetical protein K2G63_06945 [Oscillospiraceae bacterium]|nr:hypothetical protein [Oscillospiraceae bacterium]
MRKKLFLIAMLSALCMLAYGCGSHEFESESSSVSIIENPVSTTSVNTEISQTEILSIHTEQITKAPVTSSVIVSSDVAEQTSVTTVNVVTNANIQTTFNLNVETTKLVTFKSPSGETEFHQITNKHAQYEERVPTVLKPHEPVIYTTAPPVSSETETETTVSAINPTDPSEEFTETTTESVIPPEPVTTNEMYYNGMTPGDDIFNLISSFGEYESLNSSPSYYYNDEGIQGEDRHYYFPDFEIYTCWFEDCEILKEIVIKDYSYETSRGILLGMNAEDITSLYGFGAYDDLGYIYYPYPDDDSLYICFHTDEYDEIDYIVYHKDLK